MSVFKEIDFTDAKTQERLTRLVKEATEIVVGEANEGTPMNDTFANLDMQIFLNVNQNSLRLRDLE